MRGMEDGKLEARTEEEQAIRITEDMLVPMRPKDNRIPFEKTMSGFPLLIAVIIVVNAVIFGWELATGALNSRESVIAAGALYREKVLQGEYWRLISAAFLHGGVEHIMGNCVAMYILGMANEHGFGLVRTGAIYLVSALAGSILSMTMSTGPAIGASGAVFGLMGSIVVMFYKNRDRFYLRDRGIGTFVGALAVLQIVMGFTKPYIDNWAHLGGFIGGGGMAFLLRPALLTAEGNQNLAGKTKAVLAGAAAALCMGAFLAGGFMWSLEAMAYMALGKPAPAVEAATKSLAANADNAYPYFVRGSAYLQQQQPEKAIADLEQYLQRNSWDGYAAYQVGVAYYEQGQFKTAITYYSQAIGRNPRDVHYLNSRGYSYILVGDYRAARADFDALLRIDGRFAFAYGNIGLLYAIEGDYPKALEYLHKAHKMDASQGVLGKLIEALDYETKRKRPEAIASYGQFIAGIKNRDSWLAEIKFAEERIRILKNGR